jgi:hypothetical protein
MATNPIPQPLAPAKGNWYPTYPPDTPQWMQIAFRRAFDSIYQIQGQLSATGVFANGSGTVPVPKSPNWAQVKNCTLIFSRAGLWTVFGSVTFDIKLAGDVNFAFLVSLLVSGLSSANPSTVIVKPNAIQQGTPQALVQSQPTQITVSGVWQFRVVANGVAQLQVQKAAGASATLTSVADAANSMIGAVWCGN